MAFGNVRKAVPYIMCSKMSEEQWHAVGEEIK
jgi:hypothetical protein